MSQAPNLLLLSGLLFFLLSLLGFVSVRLRMFSSLSVQWIFEAVLRGFLAVMLESQNEPCGFLSCPCSGIVSPPVLTKELCAACQNPL